MPRVLGGWAFSYERSAPVIHRAPTSRRRQTEVRSVAAASNFTVSADPNFSQAAQDASNAQDETGSGGDAHLRPLLSLIARLTRRARRPRWALLQVGEPARATQPSALGDAS